MTSYCSKGKRSCARIYLRPSAGRFRPGGDARQAGGGFQVTPNAFLNDGLMDVMAITNFQTRELGLVIQELQDFTNNGLWDETGEPFLETLRTDPGEYAIYHSVSRGNETQDYIFLQFWMFENYSTGSHFPEIVSGYPTVVHEGDIEYMQTTVRLEPPGATDSKSDWFMPIAVTASQHYYAQTLRYYAQTLRWLPDDGSPAGQAHTQTHVEHGANKGPVIYVAQGSHAKGTASRPSRDSGPRPQGSSTGMAGALFAGSCLC
jgi:hypothetical protein